VKIGQLRRDGPGTREMPFRYLLSARMEHWKTDVTAAFRMPELMEEFYARKR
jgi:hypothetical protein